MKGFDEIYETYFDYVFRYMKNLTHNASLAEEITSETFFKALNAIDGFRGDCDVRVWLCQIAKNCYYTYLKKHKNLESDDAQLEQIADDDSLEELIVRKDDLANIRSLLHELNEPYKEVFMWRVFGELTFKQIGALFHKTENWACVTYHRARKMIITGLENEQNEK